MLSPCRCCTAACVGPRCSCAHCMTIATSSCACCTGSTVISAAGVLSRVARGQLLNHGSTTAVLICIAYAQLLAWSALDLDGWSSMMHRGSSLNWRNGCKNQGCCTCTSIQAVLLVPTALACPVQGVVSGQSDLIGFWDQWYVLSAHPPTVSCTLGVLWLVRAASVIMTNQSDTAMLRTPES